MTLPTDAQERKDIPIYSGFIKYFPLGIAEVARLSKIGNDQHNPGLPLFWDRSKSTDELDAMCRHMVDDASGVPMDSDGVSHKAKVAWRAMADLEKSLEMAASLATPTNEGAFRSECVMENHAAYASQINLRPPSSSKDWDMIATAQAKLEASARIMKERNQ